MTAETFLKIIAMWFVIVIALASLWVAVSCYRDRRYRRAARKEARHE